MSSGKELEQLDVVTERPIASVASGCLYAAYVVTVSAGLLFINALVCLGIYSQLPQAEDEQIASRVGQLLFFVIPLIMLVVEWNLLDRLQRLFRSELN
ncbi:MAG: hypothetical protein AB8B50_13540 [Pirellulaceae bacterium]